MTRKVQEVGNRKPKGKNQDGLSKEERQKRYDNKACLRCGEIEHFCKDCLKNELTKRVQEVVQMLRTMLYLKLVKLDETLSDLDLYEEA